MHLSNSKTAGLRSATWIASLTVGMLTLLYLTAIVVAITILVIWVSSVPLPRNGRAAVLVVVVPVFLLSFVIFFLIRSTIKTDPFSEAWVIITEKDEPSLWRMLRSISNELGLNNYTFSVKLTQESNAKLFLPSVLSNQLELRIGMPVLLALTPLQIAFVLAHELSHASQRRQIRPWLFSEAIEGWFRRFLSSSPVSREIRKQAHGSVLIIIWGVIVTFWCLKLIVFLLYLPISLVVSNLRHKMEYDADRNAASIIGVSNACLSLKSLHELSTAVATAKQTSFLSKDPWEIQILNVYNNSGTHLAHGNDNILSLYPSTAERIQAITSGAKTLSQPIAKCIDEFALRTPDVWCRHLDTNPTQYQTASQIRSDLCWWCGKRKKFDSLAYELDRKDKQSEREHRVVLIHRCEKCKTLMTRTLNYTILAGIAGFIGPILLAIIYPSDASTDERARSAIAGLLIFCPVSAYVGFWIGSRELKKDSRYAHWSTVRKHPEVRYRIETNWHLTGKVSILDESHGDG